MPEETQGYTNITEYQEEVVLPLASAHELAAANIKKAQKHYKQQYDHHTTVVDCRVGDLVSTG